MADSRAALHYSVSSGTIPGRHVKIKAGLEVQFSGRMLACFHEVLDEKEMGGGIEAEKKIPVMMTKIYELLQRHV